MDGTNRCPDALFIAVAGNTESRIPRWTPTKLPFAKPVNRVVRGSYPTEVTMAAELSKKSEFVVLASSDAAKKLGNTFESTIEPPTGKGPTCTVTIKYAANKFGAANVPDQLRLKCGQWERVIACKLE